MKAIGEAILSNEDRTPVWILGYSNLNSEGEKGEDVILIKGKADSFGEYMKVDISQLNDINEFHDEE